MNEDSVKMRLKCFFFQRLVTQLVRDSLSRRQQSRDNNANYKRGRREGRDI